MPVRQDTFKLLPTTLVNTGPPRPPMTSKAAKKAYREANKLPKISKAEQRRIEAEELARQKKEWEKEKAAAKAKAAREKKLKKETEEREKRKRLGLPEPSRFVRASQPTIKTFVKSGLGRKRSRTEAYNEEPGSGSDDHRTTNLDNEVEPQAKRTALNRADDDDDFGDFPSLSQVDLPGLFAEPEMCQKQTGSPGTSRPVLLRSSTSRPCGSILTPEPNQHELFIHVQSADKADVSAHAHAAGPYKVLNEITRAMPPPPVPMAVNRLRPRNPLSEVSRNMAPPSHPRFKTDTSTTTVATKLREDLSLSPPSTLAFLEAHLDDFFPSPSQQVRELLEDVDDVPSNTQIAREIKQDDAEHGAPPPPATLLISQPQVEEELLLFLSSQDLDISSQDLKDIDTPSQAPQTSSPPLELKAQHPVRNESMPPAPHSTPRPKPRFFEEKEDDLLHAALHESLLSAKQSLKGSSPRRSQRILRRTQPNKIVREEDNYGSDGSDIGTELLALLDKCDTADSTAWGNADEI